MSAHFLFVHVNLLAPTESPDTIPISEAAILAHLQNHGFSGQILGDFADAPLKPRILAQTIDAAQPAAIGFTAYQENIEQIRLWARLAKKIVPDTKIILGGPQITFMPGEALNHMPEVDFLCRGEGEQTMLSLAQALTGGTDLGEVPGLCFLRTGQIVETGLAQGAKDLDTYASPYLTDLIDLRQKDRAILLTSRGCAYDCAFCYTPRASQKKVRFFSIERVLDEMKYLRSKGIRAFWFADTNFSVSRDRLVTFLEAVIREVPGVTFWCQTRYDLINSELLALLKRAGAENIAYGLESANPSVLENIRKPIDLQRLSEVIRMTQEAGIPVELFSMFGLPGETFDQALNTLAFVKKKNVSVDGNSISQQAHLFFGTPLNDAPEDYGIRPFKLTRPAHLSACRDFETDMMSKEQIRRVSLIWRLNRDDFARDVQTGKNLFHRAAFITQNRDVLADRPEANRLLAQVYVALEEYHAAADCMRLLDEQFDDQQAVREFLDSPFSCFRLSPGRASEGYKVVFDCRGSVDGKVIAATFGRFQEAVLGEGALLPGFEEHIMGMVSGESKEFEVTFPFDYGANALAGKAVDFRVHTHCVMEPVVVKGYGQLKSEAPNNRYSFNDLEVLKKFNIHLYYRAINHTVRGGFIPPMPDALMLVNLYLRLGFVDRAMALVRRLPDNPVALNQVAYVFQINGQSQKALDYLDESGQESEKERLVRVQALCDLNRLEEAEGLAGSINMPGDVKLAELRVDLAAKLILPIKTYLEREEALLDARTKAML